MLDHQRALDQLSGLKRKLGQGGREIIDHPKGAHDDLANCVAGVLWRLTPVKPKIFMGVVPVLSKSNYGGHACYGDHPSGSGAQRTSLCLLGAKSGQTCLDDMRWFIDPNRRFGINLVWLNFLNLFAYPV